jgi:V8-like Glu-specific endopeptidase
MSERLFPLLTQASADCHPVKSLLTLSRSICAGLVLGLSIGGCLVDVGVNAAIYDRTGRKIPDREVNSDRVNWQMLSVVASRKYNGVGSVDLDYGVCTGFLIATGLKPTNAPAYVVTNGHCQGSASKLPSHSDILVNQPSKTNFIVNYFHDFKADRLSIPVKRMVYGTMKNNDIAILELTKTQLELTKAGITPLQISTKPASRGESVMVVGIPSQGVRDALSFLHAATCQTGETVQLKEDIYHWNRSVRHHCSIIGGMSGSPMISLKTRRVVGIINTGVNDSAAKQPQCSLNRPCEVRQNGRIETFAQENYGQLVHQIPTCFDRQGVFDLRTPGCKLEKPRA